ncbi:MAG TPA: amino acid adenylation domain-containing protein [Bacillota bacterium]|nr:amino acid adenylation domain-containing protein [Bacillota bacterium]
MSLDQYTQNIILSGGEFEAEQKYWEEKLQGEISICALPGGPESQGVHQYQGAELKSGLRAPIREKIMALSKNSPYGLYMILVGAFNYLLFRYTGKEDIIIAMPVFKREGGDQSLNSFVLLRNTVDENLTFKDFLLAVRGTITEADEHSNYPFEKIAEFCRLENLNDGTPDLKTVVLLEQIHDRGQLEKAAADLICSFSALEDSLEFTMEYNANFYHRELIAGLAGHLTHILGAVVCNPNGKLGAIEMLAPAEKRYLLEEVNGERAEYPRQKTIHRLFFEQAVRNPDRPAITFQERTISYRELNEKSNQLARRLQEIGVKPGEIIGIMLERSPEMIIGLLGVLKAGAAYLPLDPDYPEERIRYMMEDSGAGVLLVNGTVTVPGKVPTNSGTGASENLIQIVNLIDEELYRGPDSNLEDINQPSDLAYVIYTSGTTGRPKGAMIEHRNLVRLMFNDKFQFDFTENDVWTMFHSFCFDFSVWEIYGALLYGGRLVIVPKPVAQDPGEYLRLLKKHAVTVLNQTPTAFAGLIREELQCPDHTLALRYVIFGGEALKPLMLKEWRPKYPAVKLINMYGITETTVHVTYKEITDREIESNISNIGNPIPTLTAYIMDPKLRLLPVGAIGELCVGGDGVGRGYLNRPELTGEKFVVGAFRESPPEEGPPPAEGQPLRRIYRSGDLAKRLPNGEMEYFGRMDHQVKIRGHRIELGEIESALLRYDPIQEVALIAGEDADHQQYICAYYVSKTSLTVPELRGYLGELLPVYMIPAYFIRLEKIPMTVNHKLDRRALPRPDSGISTGEIYEAPQNEVESKLVEIWRDALSIEAIGVNNSFFDLGGDSIKAIGLISKVNREFGAKILLADLYQNQTVREIAACLATERPAGVYEDLREGLERMAALKKSIEDDAEAAEGLSGAYEDFYPLSPIQQGMVFFTMLRPEEPIYHDQFPYLVKVDRFDLKVFNEAILLLARKHPILRTVFSVERFNQPLQFVQSVNHLPGPLVELTDLSGLTEREQENQIHAYMAADLQSKFRFENELLWRMRVFQLGADNFCLVLSFQHAVLDGWSVASMFTELLEIFNRLLTGVPAEIQPLKSSYKDYVAISISRRASQKLREFWLDYLKGYSRNKLPFNISNKKISNATGCKILRRDLDLNLLRALEETARGYRSSLQDIFLAAHIYLLGLITTETDVVTGVVTHDRPVLEDSERVLGCYLNTIPIRVQTAGEIKKTEFLELVKNNRRKVKANELFLADIAGIAGENNSSGNPIFDTLHNFTDFHVMKSIQTAGNIHPGERDLHIDSNEMTNTLMDLEVSRTMDVFSMQIKYSPKYFAAEDIQTAADLYQRILEKFAYDPGENLRNEELLSSQEFKELVYDFNRTQVEYPSAKTMHQLFEEQTARTPEVIALILGDESLTYAVLNEKANQLGRLLLEKGVKSGDHVALITERSFTMITAMLAVLKCGAAYVPIDPEYPLARQEYIAANSKVCAVLTDEEYPIQHENKIVIDWDKFGSYSKENLELKKDSRDLAYVIYTSGSTGVPKGVMIEHHSAVNLILWVNREFQTGCNDRLLFMTSMCFDLSVYDIFGILAAGGQVVIARKEQVQNPEELKELLTKYQITFWDSVPSTMNFLVNYCEENYPTYRQESLRLVFMSGDWIPVSLPGRLRAYFPKARPISLGGGHGRDSLVHLLPH